MRRENLLVFIFIICVCVLITSTPLFGFSRNRIIIEKPIIRCNGYASKMCQAMQERIPVLLGEKLQELGFEIIPDTQRKRLIQEIDFAYSKYADPRYRYQVQKGRMLPGTLLLTLSGSIEGKTENPTGFKYKNFGYGWISSWIRLDLMGELTDVQIGRVLRFFEVHREEDKKNNFFILSGYALGAKQVNISDLIDELLESTIEEIAEKVADELKDEDEELMGHTGMVLEILDDNECELFFDSGLPGGHCAVINIGYEHGVRVEDKLFLGTENPWPRAFATGLVMSVSSYSSVVWYKEIKEGVVETGTKVLEVVESGRIEKTEKKKKGYRFKINNE